VFKIDGIQNAYNVQNNIKYTILMETTEINKLPNNFQQNNNTNQPNDSYYNENNTQQHNEIPNRDRIINPDKLTSDESTKVNFIPDNENDIYYIPTRQEMQSQQPPAPTQNMFSNITAEELRMPLFLMLLYIVFEFPMIRNFVKKTFQFAYNEQEQITFPGIIISGFLFSCTYFIITKLIESQ